MIPCRHDTSLAPIPNDDSEVPFDLIEKVVAPSSVRRQHVRGKGGAGRYPCTRQRLAQFADVVEGRVGCDSSTVVESHPRTVGAFLAYLPSVGNGA